MPWTIVKRNNEFCVYKEGQDGHAVGDAMGCHPSRAAAEKQVQALHANVEEFRGPINDVLVITELRGSYPTVPISSDVDYDALVQGDSDPMFLTIPIGQAGVTSGNKRYYDDAFVTELERQTVANKPIGLMGHLSETDRATAFPPEAVHWVGALREGDTLWGKGYVPPGPVRDRIRRYKAQGKAIATSIDAFAEGVLDKATGVYRMVAETLRLNQIDIAPADRAGIPSLAAVPLLTTEMADDQDPGEEEMKEMTREELLNEMRQTRIPVNHGWQPRGNNPDPTLEMTIRETLGLSEDADVVKTIQEMRQTQLDQERKAIQSRITELSTSADQGVKLEPVRVLVMELVNSKNPQTVEEAEAAYKQVIESDAVKAALKGHVRETMGPPQTNGLNGKTSARYFQIPPDEK